MSKLILILILSNSLTLASGQKYLINNAVWVSKIKQNPSLSPLSVGIERTEGQVVRDSETVNWLVKKYKTKDLAYKHMIIDGWNYFTIGKLDSAILSFNQAYLVDNVNLEAFFAIGSLITFLDDEPSNQLIEHFNLAERVSDPWDLTAFYGDLTFLEELKAITRSFLQNNHYLRF